MEPSELSSIDLLLQFSEESGELIQSIAKLVRKERDKNPTPVAMEQCLINLTEVIADVLVVLDVLVEHWEIPSDDIELIKQIKLARWRERLSR